MLTRRALLGAGAVALLAGCGAQEDPEVVPSEVLAGQLELATLAAAAYEGVPDAARERARSQARVGRLTTAVAAAGGKLTPTRSWVEAGLKEALAAERRALAAYVQGVGLLTAREHRELLGGLIADTAADESALLMRLGHRPIPSSFPGQPAR
jgi:hypothetical protein